MNVNVMLALGIMWKGMLGIFVVMGIHTQQANQSVGQLHDQKRNRIKQLPHEGGRPLAHHPARHSAQCAHGEDREKSFGVFRDTVLLGEGHEI